MQVRQLLTINGCWVSALLLLATAGAYGEESARVRDERALPTSLPAEEIEFTPDITYAKPGGRILNLNMARPKHAEGLLPAVVCIHGGGWISGSRTRMDDQYVKYLAGYGYVAVTPSYRFAPDDPFPAAVVDVRNCVRWLRRHAKEYGIDPDRIGATGLSAGGHLSAMLGVASDKDSFGEDDKDDAGTSARVQAVVNYFGPGDLAADDWSKLAEEKFLIPFIGGTKEERREAYAKASPVTYVSKDDPPILTFQGDKDLTVPVTQAKELHKKLEAAGVKNRLVIVEGQGHGWGEPHLTRTRQGMVRFFNATLKGEKAAASKARE